MATWRLDSAVTDRYMKLDQGDNVLATYVWIDGTGEVRMEGGRVGGYTVCCSLRRFVCCSIVWAMG